MCYLLRRAFVRRHFLFQMIINKKRRRFCPAVFRMPRKEGKEKKKWAF